MKNGICALIKGEQDYLDEWIQYNISIGFTDLYLYEDTTSGTHKEITDKYTQCHLYSINDTISISDCPTKISKKQHQLYNWFIQQVQNKVIDLDWCVFINVNEFVTFENGYNLEKLLSEYKNHPGLYLYRKSYGANGHIYKPNGKVQDNYTKDSNLLENIGDEQFKSFVNFKYTSFNFKDDSHYKVRGLMTTSNIPNSRVPSYKKCWINHYFTKSLEEWIQKLKKYDNYLAEPKKIEHFFKYNTDIDETKSLTELYQYKNTDNTEIPRVINYIWLSGEEIPESYQKYIDTWKQIMPDYEYKLWTQDNFDVDAHPFVKTAIEEKNWAFASDYMRLWILYNYGGIYLDADVQVLKRFDDLLQFPYVIGKEAYTDERITIEAAVMMSKPKQEVFKVALDWYKDKIYGEESIIKFEVIPIIMLNTYEEYKYHLHLIHDKKDYISLFNYINIFDPLFFCPLNCSTNKMGDLSKAYTIHWYNHGWIYAYNETHTVDKQI